MKPRLFQKQRNKYHICKKLKQEYFSSVTVNKVANKKSFLKIVKPFLSKKTVSSKRITLVGNDDLITDEQIVVNTLNEFRLKHQTFHL